MAVSSPRRRRPAAVLSRSGRPVLPFRCARRPPSFSSASTSRGRARSPSPQPLPPPPSRPSGDFEGGRPEAAWGWWSWRPVQPGLHSMWMTGGLTIHSRQHFQKRFDLLERAIPDALGCEPVSSGDFQRWHIERSLNAMGAATELDLTHYLTFPRFGPGPRRAALGAMVAGGEVTAL